MSKWDPDLNPTMIPGFPRVLPQGLQKEQLDALLVRLRIEEITRKLTSGQYEEGIRERSPSPEPMYDNMGKRTNTREQRQKDKLNKERQKYVTEAMLMNPLFRPPADYVPPSQKKSRKIYIPLKEYPEYNFIGLIIGPRGNTQKRMERETGSKIAIRGKGSLKEGKLNKQQYQDDDELHVLITADTDDQVDRAAIMVRDLLIPVEEGRNEHKKNQLRELAEINGTLRDNNTWNISQRTWDAANVKCAICGEVSHPTQDCPSKNGNMPVPPPKTIDAEYESFLAEIGEKKPEVSSAGAGGPAAPEGVDTEASYEEFMAAINEVTPSKPNAMPAKPFAPGQGGMPGQQSFGNPYGRPPGVVPPGFGFPPQGFPGFRPPFVPPMYGAPGAPFFPPQNPYGRGVPFGAPNPWMAQQMQGAMQGGMPGMPGMPGMHGMMPGMGGMPGAMAQQMQGAMQGGVPGQGPPGQAPPWAR